MSSHLSSIESHGGHSQVVDNSYERVGSWVFHQDVDEFANFGAEQEFYDDLHDEQIGDYDNHSQRQEEEYHEQEDPVARMQKARIELMDKIGPDMDTSWENEKLWMKQKSYPEYKSKITALLEQEKKFLAKTASDKEPTNFLQHILGVAINFSPHEARLHKAKFFIRIIADTDPTQMNPRWGPKPLHAAVEFDIKVLRGANATGNITSDMTSYMCNLMGDMAATAISERNSANENILHLAIRHNLVGLEQFIKKAEKSAFRQRRSSQGEESEGPFDDGNTPLHDVLLSKSFMVHVPICPVPFINPKHYGAGSRSASMSSDAVSQSQSAARPSATSNGQSINQALSPCSACLKAQEIRSDVWKKKINIIELLLERDRETMMVHNSAGMPPYLYLHLRLEKARKDRKAPKSTTSLANGQPQTSTSDMDAHRKIKKDDSKMTIASSKDVTDDKKKFFQKEKEEAQSKGQEREPLDMKDIEAQNKNSSGGNRNAGGRPALKNTQLTPHKYQDLPMVNMNLPTILEKLKEHIFKLGDFKKTYDCLFRSQSITNAVPANGDISRQRRFILEGKQRISRNTTKHFDFLIFEPMMAIVTLSLEYTPEELKDMANDEANRLDRWRQDEENLKSVFQWLKVRKNVKTILSLTIKDNPHHYCSDDTIEKCLAGLDIMYLNWNRPDICANELTLPRSLIEISLYWTGLNAVLWSWSDTGGLRTLQNLQKVFLYVQRGIELPEQQDKKVERFQDRVAQWTNPTKPEIVVRDDTKHLSGDGSGGSLTQEPKTPIHPWLVSVSRFRDTLYTKLKNDSTVSKRRYHTKVALIDDGVDPTYDSLGIDIYHQGWPLVGSEELEEGTKSFYISTNQHGSKMAWLIRKVCPFVTLYVAKLDVINAKDLRHRTFSLQQAKEAIEWATSQGVDIISMSWNARQVTGSTGNEDEIRQLEGAIGAAYHKNILMFGAACDVKESSSSDKWVPCDDSRVLSIGATDVDFDAKKYVDVNKVNYLFPGEHLLSRSKDPEVGNSGATALAAGLAALVLYCMRINNQQLPVDRKKWINNVMMKVFESETNKKVVHVKNVLRLDDSNGLHDLSLRFAAQR